MRSQVPPKTQIRALALLAGQGTSAASTESARRSGPISCRPGLSTHLPGLEKGISHLGDAEQHVRRLLSSCHLNTICNITCLQFRPEG